MASTVVLATRNAHKIDEMRRILAEAEVNITLIPVDDGAPDVAETESTFAGNALLKARAVSEFMGLPAIADDSGLCVDALGGMPGVLSARWCGRHGDDLSNLNLVLGQMSEVPSSRRGARFVCAAALVVPASVVESSYECVVEGSLEGHLVDEPRGENGFGYDPIFVPSGMSLTTAQLSAADKDAISHRGQAMRGLVPILRDVVAPPSSA